MANQRSLAMELGSVERGAGWQLGGADALDGLAVEAWLVHREAQQVECGVPVLERVRSEPRISSRLASKGDFQRLVRHRAVEGGGVHVRPRPHPAARDEAGDARLSAGS